MSKGHEKMMTDLHRLMSTQDFKSEADLKKFMASMIGQKIPSFPKETLNDREQAQDLVFDAYELPLEYAKQNCAQALQLAPDLIEAYELLGSLEEWPEISTVFYEKGISLGRQQFGGKFLKENKGDYWGIHATRPFMRCLHQYAECLYNTEKIKECILVYEEMIELNQNDNQGVRDLLMLHLIELGEKKKFLKYAKMFENDYCAYALFNRALFTFKYEGATESANKQLREAINQNKFVAKKIISKKVIDTLIDHYSIGDENEANYYVAYAQDAWKQTQGATDWLKKQSTNSKL